MDITIRGRCVAINMFTMGPYMHGCPMPPKGTVTHIPLVFRATKWDSHAHTINGSRQQEPVKLVLQAPM